MIHHDYTFASAHGQAVDSIGRLGHKVASLARSLPNWNRTVTALRWQGLAAGLAALIIAWSVAIVTIPEARFAVTAPVAQAGVEAASALARLFAALVLILFPTERSGPRLHWVAGGLVVLGLKIPISKWLADRMELAVAANAGKHPAINEALLPQPPQTAQGDVFVAGHQPDQLRGWAESIAENRF